MALFNRQYKLIVGDPGKDGIAVTDLRVVFTVKASRSKTANESIIRVFNLAEATAARIQTGQVAQLSAGYLGQIAPICTGDVTRIESYLDGVDRVTEITVEDSLVAMRDSKTSMSFPPNTSGETILAAVGANFGLPVRMNVTGTDKQFTRGFAFNGRTRNALTEVCEMLGLEWSAQQGEIQIINKGAAFSKQAIVLSPESGLIDYPKPKAKTLSDKKAGKAGIKYGQDGVRRYTKTDPNAKVKDRTQYAVEGYTVKALLNAAIFPGAYVQLTSRGVQGKFFVVDECTFTGDSDGAGEWTVEAALLYPQELKQNGK